MKFKIQSQNKLTTTKEGIIVIGVDQETKNPIIIPVKTISCLDKNKNKAINDLRNKVKIPKKVKKYSSLTREEKSLVALSEGNKEENSWITIWDETSPEYLDNKNELELIETLIKLIVNFDMDYLTEDGITIWEDFDLPKGDYLALAYYLIEKKGIDESHIIIIQDELMRLKKMEKTYGEIFYEEKMGVKDLEDELVKIKNDLKEDSYGDEI